MDIIKRYSNVFNYDFEIVFLYNIHSSLAVLIYGSWSIRYLEAKVLYDESEPLDHFGV